MAGSKMILQNITFAIIFLAAVGFNFIAAHRLNVPRVLLPVFNDFPVNFTLEVTESGCYQWSTSRPDVVRLLPIHEEYGLGCSSGSSAVIVQTVTKEPIRNTAIVLAEDLNTGQLLRCDVIVDAIFSLNIVTTTRELFIEEAPEAFEIRADDEQGNEFTTLAGIEFTWSIGNTDKIISQQNEIKQNNVLRFMTFQESPYETPHTVTSLDAFGKKGHIVLLEGIQTGSAKVSAKLPYSEYKHVPPVEVELIVVANLLIMPTDITIMAFDSFRYKIMQVHQGRLEEINLPSSPYYLKAENPSVIEINNDLGTAYALSMGKTRVHLHDKNVHEEYGVILPSAHVNVNEVSYITLTVLPHRNWGLILGQSHELVVELFDKKDHKFHIGEGVEVTVDIDENYFQCQTVSQNGTYITGIPITPGTTIAEATLHGVINKKGKKIFLPVPLKVQVELDINPAVTVTPKTLAIPWDPKIKTRFDIALKANGGDGIFTWTSKNPEIVSVTQNGILQLLQRGSTEVSVAMTRNQYNHDVAKIHILTATRLEVIEYNMEAAVNQPIYLHIALFGKYSDGNEHKEIAFNDCKNIPFELYIPQGNFVQSNEMTSSENQRPVGISCAVLTIVGLEPGTSDVTVAYNSNNQFLSDNVTVSAYEPLVTVHPESGESLLAVGSSRKFIFKGGPNPREGRYSKTFEVSNKESVDVTEEKSELNVWIFQVLCKSLGESTLRLTVANSPILNNCKRSEATVQVRVVCGKPRYLFLQPEYEESGCPINENYDKMISAHASRPLKLLVTVKDDDGHSFDNISSLAIDWNSVPSANALMEVHSGVIEEHLIDYRVALPKSHYQLVTSKRSFGSVNIHAKVVGYQRYLEVTPEWPPFPVENERGIFVTPLIEASVTIHLVNDTTIQPNRLKILNDPSSRYFLQVSQGSGFYEFVLSNEDIAEIQYLEQSKTISVVPKRSGTLHIALVDLCFASKPAEVVVEVQQLGSIQVDSVNKIEKGRCVVAAVKFYDTSGHIMRLPSLDTLELKYEFESSVIDVKRLPANEQSSNAPYEEILYAIHGNEEGEVPLTFVCCKTSDHEIRSEPLVVQVFLPLKVAPKNLTILVGTVYQVTTTGGPLNSEIEFTTDDESVSKVNYRSGILQGKAVGVGRLSARAVGLDSRGQKVIYSQDHAEINVSVLDGIKIVTPTSRIKIGAVLPLWVFGIPENLTPLIIGSLDTSLIFLWSSSDSNLLTLHNMYEGTGINIRFHNEVSVRAKALKAGTVTIYLNVTVPNLSNSYKETYLSTSVKVEIFEELRITNLGSASTSSVPLIYMAPNSLLRLTTNRDKFGLTTYKILQVGYGNESSSPYSDVTAVSTNNNVVTIDKSGIIKSSDTFGKTTVLVTNVENFGLKQTLTIIVEVKPIHYMMLSLKSKLRIRENEELNVLPKGMELHYVLEYFDNVGTKFHGAQTKSHISLNRVDLVSFALPNSNDFQENTIVSKFLENGEVIVKVYNDRLQNTMFDYVNMRIGDILFPTKTSITVGDVVCFSMPLLANDGDPGYWQSTEAQILSIDPTTGVGRAKTPGHAFVKHSLATFSPDVVEITVNPVAKISLVPLRGKNITATETFSVPLVLKSKEERIKENNVLSRNLGGCRTYTSFSLTSFPYSCSIQFASTPSVSVNIKDLFLVKPRFDIVTGFYYCDVIPIGLPTMLSSTLQSRIRINAQTRGDIEGIPLEVSFLPPIYVATKEIVFYTNTAYTQVPATAVVEIYGLRPILEHIVIDGPQGLTLSSPQFTSKYMVEYKFRLMEGQEDEIQGRKVYIFNELTKQNVSLLVRVSKYQSYTGLPGTHWIDYLYYHRYTLVALVAVIVTSLWIWKNKFVNADLSVRNRSIFVEKNSPGPKSPLNATCSPDCSRTSNSSGTPKTPNSPLKPFSAFEPVYGDPRGFYTPSSRRNRTLNC